MENIIRTAVTATMDTIEASEGYVLVNAPEGGMIETLEIIYVKKDTTPAGFMTMTPSELDALTTRINYAWEKYLDKTIEAGTKVYCEGKIYEVRQEHTPLIIWPPSEVPALYKLSSLSEGTQDDPINWESGMTCYNGKYYVFNGKLYEGVRDSIDPLYFNPADLLGNYFNEVENEEIGGGNEPAEEQGTRSNPIAWEIGMISENGKYYSSNNVVYRCIRDSGTPLYFEPGALLGNYFEVVQV